MDIKYTPGRKYIEIDGIRFTVRGYTGGASVRAEQAYNNKVDAVLRVMVTSLKFADAVFPDVLLTK